MKGGGGGERESFAVWSGLDNRAVIAGDAFNEGLYSIICSERFPLSMRKPTFTNYLDLSLCLHVCPI